MTWCLVGCVGCFRSEFRVRKCVGVSWTVTAVDHRLCGKHQTSVWWLDGRWKVGNRTWEWVEPTGKTHLFLSSWFDGVYYAAGGCCCFVLLVGCTIFAIIINPTLGGFYVFSFSCVFLNHGLCLVKGLKQNHLFFLGAMHIEFFLF